MLGKDSSSDSTGCNRSRRKFLQTVYTVGGVSALSSVSRAVNPTRKNEPPNPYPDSGGQNVSYFTHLAEFESRKRRVKRFESNGDSSELFSYALKQRLKENPSQSQFDVAVNTMGTRTSMVRDKDGQTLYGFRPKRGEVKALENLGKVTHVGDLVSTKVCLREVPRENLEKIARLPSVLELTPMGQNFSLSNVSASDVEGSSWDNFTAAHGNYNSGSLTIGIVEGGYDTSYQPYASNYAADIGFDRSLSKDFSDENDPFTATSIVPEHAAWVGDTAAFMLKDGSTHSDQFVALKVFSDSDDTSSDVDENTRAMLEYATKNYIDVINMSYGFESYNRCPNIYCEELDSYVSGDGIPVAAVGNVDNQGKVEHPACSWHTVAVGGVKSKDSNGNALTKELTEYGTITYYESSLDKTYCPWCEIHAQESFAPECYGVSNIKTDAGNTSTGTSYAAPQVAASAWIDACDGGITSYSDVVNKFKNMNDAEVMDGDKSSDPSQEGDLLEADYYF